MAPGRGIPLAAALAFALGTSGASVPGVGGQQPGGAPAPQFRSGVTAVPINVRVVDSTGAPITDLRKSDFTILEDGVAQTIAVFSSHVLAAAAPSRDLRASPDAQPFDNSPQNHRVFLIVLGWGALKDASRHPDTVDALASFVRRRLLPQDQVALLGYNRAVDFTADHEKVARQIEAFKGPAALATATVERQGGLEPDGTAPPLIPTAAATAADEDALGFEAFVRPMLGQPLGDIDGLLHGIRYLQHLPGEKHLIYISEKGPTTPGDQYDQSLDTWAVTGNLRQVARAAANARVALDTIQLGQPIIDTMPKGVPTPGPAAPLVRRIGGEEPPPAASGGAAGGANALGSPTAPYAEAGVFVFGTKGPLAGLTAMYDLAFTAAQTGGLAASRTAAAPALSRIDDASRAYYLLAYYPTNGDWNGRFRAVKVQVRRPGATVLFRHGYYASRTLEVFDRRRIVTDARIDSAAGRVQGAGTGELDVQARAAYVTTAGSELVVELSLDASRLSWTLDADGRHVANIEVAMYATDIGGDNLKVLGETRRALKIALTGQSYDLLARDRFTRVLRMSVRSRPGFAKIIVYDYDADRLGSATVRVK